MKHLKSINEGLSYSEFTDILMSTPIYYPIFKVTKNWKEYYTGVNKLITKDTEVYSPDINSIEVKTLDYNNILTEISEDYLEFVEYRSKVKIDEQLKMYYNDTDKYNL